MNISQTNYLHLREFIKDFCGISLGDELTHMAESRLTHLAMESDCRDYNEFYLKIKNDPRGTLRDKIIDTLIDDATQWFDDIHPWTTIKEVVLPALINEVESGRKSKIRFWSAACSTGQEPYSLAMIIDETLSNLNSKNVTRECFEIVATDILSGSLFMAISGRYAQSEMSRGLEDHYRNRYFVHKGNGWEISDTIRKMVAFKKFNLQDPLASLGAFDVALCRNVAVYFSDAFTKSLLERIALALIPPGYLFLGAAESIMGYSSAYELFEHNKAVFYKLNIP